MRLRPRSPLLAALLAACATPPTGAPGQAVPLDQIRLVPFGVNTEFVDYVGRRALRVTEHDGDPTRLGLLLLDGVAMRDGSIDLQVAGRPRPDAPEGARGFVGVAFRVRPGAAQFEYVYLRPTNGRADDQLRRNHSTQYAAHPDWPWQRLRRESPGVYESYVDLEPGAWTHLRIVVAGTSARLCVGDAAQPCLLVDNLKLGSDGGGIGLWIGGGTEAWFADLSVAQSP